MEIYVSFRDEDALTGFRIMVLHPGEWEDEIDCQLIYTALDKAPKYQALSYAWGSRRATRPVIINHEEIDVTVNLESALRHLRRRDTDLLLWADALVRQTRAYNVNLRNKR